MPVFWSMSWSALCFPAHKLFTVSASSSLTLQALISLFLKFWFPFLKKSFNY
ncbi:hypothetical protein GQ43DRAFT_438212 [Delitschia confertaspora ATCC 74209]|uniref:Uncharacterized protein n=1 Tax=Delitschia confertaspora ATCC 74209 TaxID=1513339 RepID=A0A9P4JTI1_9PLEO|nr:hypothetical protein GQ43DRAFT_438212 [Delitschia confertaspora ATCC 74209]